MKRSASRAKVRAFKASWRDTLLLLGEFKQPLLGFIFALVISGGAYYWLSGIKDPSPPGLIESVYIVLGLTFLQPLVEFPNYWYLQLFFFLMPIIGISILAQGLADFGIMLFNRRARSKEWEMAVASTYDNHIVLVGMGHLGFRVIQQLHEMEQDIVVVTLDPSMDLIEKVRSMDIPVIVDNASRESILEAAGIRHARAIILCTQNDVLNLQIAVKSRSINPKILVVVRIFDDDFAESLHDQFGFQAFSATSMAAPIFAAAAVDIDLTPPINIAGQPNSLARITNASSSVINGLSVAEIEKQYKLSVVALDHGDQQEFHPTGDIIVKPTDTIVILGHPEQINLLVYDSKK